MQCKKRNRNCRHDSSSSATIDWLGQCARKQFSRMKDLSTHPRQQLLMARYTAGNQCARSALLVRAPHLRKEVLADRHAQFVILALISEAAGHAATFHGRSHNIEARRAQHVDGLRRGIARSLLAMRMVEEPR